MLKTVTKGIFKPNSKDSSDFTERIIKAYYNTQKTTDNENSEQIPNEHFSSKNNNDKKYLNMNDGSVNLNSSISSDKVTKQGQKNSPTPQIISIGGGKGGIGKSFLSANICVRLAALGYKVSVVDLDLGAANLHTCLGVPTPQKGISDFIHGNVSSLEETGISCCLPNLTLYGGGQEFWQQIKPQSSQKIKLISKLQELEADFVFLDLGAGTHIHTLDFFIFSHGGILVVAPEPTSIENAYVFMKSVLYRKIQSICKAFEIEEEVESELLRKISNPKSTETPFSQIINFAQKNKEVGKQIKDMIEATNIGIIMNQVRTKEDRDLGESMSVICNRYFGFSAQFLGSTRYDDAVWKSVRVRRPLIIDYPLSTIAVNINHITDRIIKMFADNQGKEKAG
ncbi:P-loop NTPase [Pigmentibacter sp. JX0631]|uniref:nucleotide-binding protein n=1 Tax=Pigmentibacter sp. JX0631 TaxID=2976982 RepID=UPI00246912DB|nr:P-loop NTPase [Pigmentibacter sp. JX0631]WGL61304.1 P-loop NTPase [Pigmentibacter sp. JX0631]